MGCCASKHELDDVRQEAALAEAVDNAHRIFMDGQSNPPIVITKEHTSPTSSKASCLPTPHPCPDPAPASDPEWRLPASDPREKQTGQTHDTSHSSDAAASEQAASPPQQQQQQQGEQSTKKPPVVIEERTQEHNYGEPPLFDDKIATIKSVKPIVVMQPSSLQDPAIVPAADIPEARQQAIKAGVLPLNSPNTTTDTTPDSPTSTTTSSASKTPSMKTATMSSPTATEEPQEDPWTVVLRKNTSATDDLVLHIPTREADFLTVAELKSQVKKELNIPTDIKLIHMGRILVNDHKLMPANQDLHNTKYVKVSDHGVIQVMAMNQH